MTGCSNCLSKLDGNATNFAGINSTLSRYKSPKVQRKPCFSAPTPSIMKSQFPLKCSRLDHGPMHICPKQCPFLGVPIPNHPESCLFDQVPMNICPKQCPFLRVPIQNHPKHCLLDQVRKNTGNRPTYTRPTRYDNRLGPNSYKDDWHIIVPRVLQDTSSCSSLCSSLCSFSSASLHEQDPSFSALQHDNGVSTLVFSFM